MFNIRKHLSYANVAATLALVFAMSGGALAATHYLITSTKQISPKVLKSLHGATGARGPAGPAGPAGAGGAGGAKGENGANGTNGTNGTSVTSKTLGKGEGGCAEGGSEFTSASGKTSACNGAKGATGNPWTAGGTLPSGATETGVWSFGPLKATTAHPFLPVASFTIPLKEPIISGAECPENEPLNEHCVAQILPPSTTSSKCTGTVETPTAAPGYLCVYVQATAELTLKEMALLSLGFEPGASTAGAVMAIGGESGVKEAAEARGTWAVTAK